MGLIAIDSDMRLCCLLRNPILKLKGISSSSSSSQIIGGTNRFILASTLSLEDEEDEEDEKDDEDRVARGRVLAFWME